ncbi:hypothetical protein [uncultured Gammaproteobacteria bacterium]|nr:hypothetical protein [uncultured Gammaproteobacteria bacterium]
MINKIQFLPNGDFFKSCSIKTKVGFILLKGYWVSLEKSPSKRKVNL